VRRHLAPALALAALDRGQFGGRPALLEQVQRHGLGQVGVEQRLPLGFQLALAPIVRRSKLHLRAG
jgi:hypothetical protein